MKLWVARLNRPGNRGDQGQWSCTIDCDYNAADYLEVIDSRGSSVSQNLGLDSEQPGLWSAPDRRSVYTLVSHTYRWYVGGGYGDYQDCEYDSFVEKFDSTGNQVLPYSGPSLSTPCDDPAVVDPWNPAQVLTHYSEFADMTVDSVTGAMYLLQNDWSVDPVSLAETLQSHELTQFGSPSLAMSVEDFMGNGPASGLNPEPIRFTAVNGELVVAGTDFREDGTIGARLRVSNVFAAPPKEDIWELGEPVAGSTVAPISTTPGRDQAFDVNCVAANKSGNVYVGGSSLGVFDGQPASNGVWLGGWLTQFYAPTPP